MRYYLWIVLVISALGALAQERTIVQTVFTAEGKPAAGAVVQASYAVRGEAMLVQQTADARGQITWTKMPSERIIVWGAAVPAGVIPADVTEVTAPLPAPTASALPGLQPGTPPRNACWLELRLPALRTEGRLLCVVDPAPAGQSSTLWSRTFPNLEVTISVSQMIPGSHFSLAGCLLGDPCLAVRLLDYYVPYTSQTRLSLSLPWQDGIAVQGRLVAKDGAPVPGVSRLAVEPVSLSGVSARAARALYRISAYQSSLFVDRGRGEFTLYSPLPGTFRVFVDLYDESVPTPPELQFAVQPGAKAVTLSLPEPLLIVPAGAELSWLRTAAPNARRTLTAAAYAPVMPVFGARERLLALWFRPMPNALTLLTPGTAKAPRTLPLRTVVICPQRADGTPFAPADISSLMLLPLLPESIPGNYRHVDVFPEGAQLEASPCYLSQPRVRVNVWPGRYLVAARRDYNTAWTSLEIPAQGPAEIAVTVAEPEKTPRPQPVPRRTVTLSWPKMPLAPRPLLVGIAYDAPDGGPQMMVMQANPDGVQCSLPLAATRISVLCPTAGVARNLPVPEGETPAVAVPAWEAGRAVRGTVVDAAGKPLAQCPLNIRLAAAPVGNVAQAITDADGKFSVQGLLPGNYLVLNAKAGPFAGWPLTIPEGEMPPVTLRMAEKPLVLKDLLPGNASQGQVWWVPERGPAVRIPYYGSQGGTCEPLSWPGKLWIIDNSIGDGQYFSYDADRGVPPMQERAAGPSLGLYLPLDLNAGQPGAVRLTGQGERAWIDVQLPNIRWQVSPELNLQAAQIDAVPPGTYTVTVATPRGLAVATATVAETGGAVTLAYPQ